MGQSLTGDNARIKALLELDKCCGDGKRRVSTFKMVLGDAKRATNWADGGVARGEPPTWLGIMGYMILLDLIGKCFAPKSWQGNHDAKKACFVKDALERFYIRAGRLDVAPADLEPLHALRCCFAHDMSPLRCDREPFYAFEVGWGNGRRVVEPATHPWNGNIDTVPRDNVTVVNVDSLMSLVGSLWSDVCLDADNGKLKCVLPGGVNELEKRYVIGFTDWKRIPDGAEEFE